MARRHGLTIGALGLVATGALAFLIMRPSDTGVQDRVRIPYLSRYALAPAGSASPTRPVAGLVADEDGAGTTLGTSKPLYVNGRPAGRIAIVIDEQSRLLVRPVELAGVFARGGISLPPVGDSNEPMPLSRLAAAGVSLRYDASRDALVLD